MQKTSVGIQGNISWPTAGFYLIMGGVEYVS